MTRNRLFWALVLILLGAALLLNNLNVLDVEVWSLFWPSFLILLGVWFLWGSLSRTPPSESEKASISLDEAQEADVKIKHGAGRLQVAGGAEPEQLLSGSFGWGLAKDVRREGKRIDATLRPAHGIFPDVFFPWSWSTGGGLDWSVAFNEHIPLRLSFETGAGEAKLNLAALLVRDLRIQTGASSTRIILPRAAGHTKMNLEAGVASVAVQVPEHVAARIRTSGGLSSVKVDEIRFPPEGDEFVSEGYQEAENKVEIKIESGLGSVSVQ